MGCGSSTTSAAKSSKKYTISIAPSERDVLEANDDLRPQSITAPREDELNEANADIQYTSVTAFRNPAPAEVINADNGHSMNANNNINSVSIKPDNGLVAEPPTEPQPSASDGPPGDTQVCTDACAATQPSDAAPFAVAEQTVADVAAAPPVTGTIPPLQHDSEEDELQPVKAASIDVELEPPPPSADIPVDTVVVGTAVDPEQPAPIDEANESSSSGEYEMPAEQVAEAPPALGAVDVGETDMRSLMEGRYSAVAEITSLSESEIRRRVSEGQPPPRSSALVEPGTGQGPIILPDMCAPGIPPKAPPRAHEPRSESSSDSSDDDSNNAKAALAIRRMKEKRSSHN